MAQSAENDASFERAYRQAVGETELAGEDYAAAIGSKRPEQIRAARAAFAAAQQRESQALDALVNSRVTFSTLLNDPMQQLDSEGIVFKRILTADTACACCTDPKCPRHYRVIPPGGGRES